MHNLFHATAKRQETNQPIKGLQPGERQRVEDLRGLHGMAAEFLNQTDAPTSIEQVVLPEHVCRTKADEDRFARGRGLLDSRDVSRSFPGVIVKNVCSSANGAKAKESQANNRNGSGYAKANYLLFQETPVRNFDIKFLDSFHPASY